MLKRSIIIIIISVTISLAIAFGGIWFLLKKDAEPPVEEQENIVEEIDLSMLQRFNVSMTVSLKQTTSKTNFLLTDIIISVQDEEMLARVEGLSDIIKAEILGVLENKTVEDLRVEGARVALTEPILESVRGIFSKQEDKDKIVAVHISKFLVQ